MKRLIQTILVAGAALAALPALALTPADLPAQQTIKIAGASAQTPGIDAVMVTWCQANTLDRYSNSTTAFPGNNYSAWFCRATGAANTSGFAAGTKLLVIKRDAGGSLVGLQQPINGTSPGMMIVDNTCAKVGANTFYTCAGVDAAGLGDGGLSDVESRIWTARGQFTPAVAFTETSCAAQAFGVAVTNAFYTQLQADQGVGTGQPSLSTADIGSALSAAGSVLNGGDWGVVTAGGAGKVVQVCRRTNTSGTQAGAEVFFLNSPCSNASPTFGQLSVATQVDFPDVVWETGSTGDEKTCLTNANANNKPNGTAWGDTDHNFAIGFLSMENTPGGSDGWKFVKLNGVSPNADAHQTENFANGNYAYGFETTLLYKNTAPATAKTFLGNMCKAFGDPTKAPRGLASIPSGGCSYAPGVPCMRYSRNANSCQAFQ